MIEQSKAVELILFDLGGVLVELGPSPIATHWLPNSSSTFCLRDWFSSPTAIEFERGQCSPLEFASALKNELNLNATPREILVAFAAWPRGPTKGAHSMLGRLKHYYRLAVLSNSNQLHWPKLTKEFGFDGLIEHFFSSHLIQVSKPDPQVFKHVLKHFELKPHQVLFFDDNQQNVNSAKSLGILSVLVKGPQDIERSIQQLGLKHPNAK